MPISPFRHLTPASRVFYGPNSLSQLKSEIERLKCKRTVVMCGRTLARSAPGLETVRSALGDVYAGAFEGVSEHSPLRSVEAAAQALKQLNADAVVALGGGSAIVTARAAGILFAEDKPAADLCTVFEPGKPPRSPRLDAPKLPQFLIPTSPTTAAAKAGAAVSLPEDGKRLNMFDPKMRAQGIFLHPGLMTAAPASLWRDASLDALSLAIQGLESNQREPLADALLLHAIRLFCGGLPRLESNPSDEDARANMMLAAFLAGQGTDFAPAGLATAIGHAVGHSHHVGNGVVNAVILPHTLRFNAPTTGNRLADVAEAMGIPIGSDAEKAVSAGCTAFFARLSLPARLRDLGVEQADLPEIAKETAKDWFYTQNPRLVAPEQLLTLLTEAW